MKDGFDGNRVDEGGFDENVDLLLADGLAGGLIEGLVGWPLRSTNIYFHHP